VAGASQRNILAAFKPERLQFRWPLTVRPSLGGKRSLVDYVCDTPIVGAKEDDGVITFLYAKRVGTSLRHLGRHFGRQRVKLNVRWHRVADRLRGILTRLRQFQVLYILFDNESLFLCQIDGARLGSDCGLISFLRPQDVFRWKKDYAERERGGDHEQSRISRHYEHLLYS
jgi:hypothetical protein